MNHRHQSRGKRLDNGTWVEGSYVPQYHSRKHRKRIDAIFFSNDLDTFRVPVDPATVGQCTGLKDKNGRLIFEGDILKVDAGIYYGSDYVGEIRFDGGAFMWFTVPSLLERRFNPANGTQDGIDSGNCEIIGNIHDNPELLSKEAP